jgi:hypothetical protein
VGFTALVDTTAVSTRLCETAGELGAVRDGGVAALDGLGSSCRSQAVSSNKTKAEVKAKGKAFLTIARASTLTSTFMK